MRHFAKAAAATVICFCCVVALAQNRTTQMVKTSLFEEGHAVALELVIYKPAGDGPFPTLMFNHGSVSNGNDLREVTYTVIYTELASYFNENGWIVVFPQRRGRGKSDGRYAEGWQPDQARYSCDSTVALAGLERAIQDVSQVTKYLQTRTDVDQSRILIGGHSKGGILSLAFAASQPDHFLGVLNFVGGWVGERCETANEINTQTFARTSAFPRPTLWLYGERDSYYRLTHSQKNFAVFRSAGGKGDFHVFTLGFLRNDHQIVHSRAVWEETMSLYLKSLK